MTTHEKALEAVAVKVSEITGCMIDRDDASEIMTQYISALTPPDVASQRCDDALFSSIGLLRALGRSDQTVHVAISELEYVRQFVSTLTHLAAENALLREREGWKLVPVEPMPMQLEQAASNLADEFGPDFVLANKSFAMAVYAAMLAASPSHQEQQENPIALDELSRRGMDERMQEVMTLLIGETVPASAAGKVTEGELWALRFGPPCACGERGLSPDDDDESGYCNDCRAAEGSSVMTKAMEEARAIALKLWNEHGGDQYGPHVETLKMPLANFGGFVVALISAARAQVKAAGCPFDGPNDLDLTDPCPVCGALGTHDSEDICPFPGRTAGGQHG